MRSRRWSTGMVARPTPNSCSNELVLQFANFDACYLFNEAQNSRVVVPAVTVDQPRARSETCCRLAVTCKRHV